MSKPETWKTWVGRTVDGKFALRQWLGGSDHSAVFLTELPGPRAQKAAIKLMAAEGGGADPQLSQLRATARLSHPHLIRIFEAGRFRIDDDAVVYVVMELSEEDLAQILPQRALEPAEVAEMLPPLLDALSYLHGSGFVHGRIKPSNVLAVGDQLKLSADQAASMAAPNSNRRRRDAYDAPETAAGIISPAGDIWSVGVTMVAATTRNISFAEESSSSGPSLPEGIPEPFLGIAHECLQLDPKRRCSLNEIQVRLHPERRSVPEPPAPAAPSPASHYRLTWRMLIPIAVLLSFPVGWFFFRNNSPLKGSEKFAIVETRPPTEVSNPPTPPTIRSAETPKKSTVSGGAVLHQVLPDIPKSAMNTITGTIKIVVRAQVDASGKVTEAKLKSSGSSRYFANHAVQAAEHWEFSPPNLNGQPTASTWNIQFRFKRSSMQASAQLVTH